MRDGIATAPGEVSIIREYTAEEIVEYNAKMSEKRAKAPAEKLAAIKQIRLHKLKETDWWILRGEITDEQTAWRKSLRDIPANFTTESQYNDLLEYKEDGTLKHSIWTQPS